MHTRKLRPASPRHQPHVPSKLSEIEPIRNMLNSPGASIEMLTCGSAKGFMFELNVNSEHSVFYNPGQHYNRITSFIVKLAVISQQNDEDLDDYIPVNNGTPIGKSTESADSYFQEAKIQQDVWMNTLTGNRLPISPPIVSFSLFDNQNGLNFLTFLNYKVKKTKSVHTITYLRTVLQNPNSNYGLGMIIMSNVLKSDTFESFIDLPRDENASFQGVHVTEHVLNDIYAKLVSKIIRLYIEVGVIHFDLHIKNALIYYHSPNSLNAYIIDYGRASNVSDNTTNEYLTPSEKHPLNIRREYLKQQIIDLCHPTKHTSHTVIVEDKIKYISSIIEPLRQLEHMKSQQLYGNPDTYSYSRYQFDWMEEIVPMTSQMVTRSNSGAKKVLFNNIAILAFDNLCHEMTVDISKGAHLSRETLSKSCMNFQGKSHSDFQTRFLATWTEWGKSLFPRTVRNIKSLFVRTGGNKRNTKLRRMPTRMHKYSRKFNKTIRNKSKFRRIL